MADDIPKLREAGWDPENERFVKKDEHGNDAWFKAARPTDRWTQDEEALDVALIACGYEDSTDRRQIRSSALDPAIKKPEGDETWGVSPVTRETDEQPSRYYAFCTVKLNDGQPAGDKRQSSAFWIREEDLKKFQEDGIIDLKYKDGELDTEHSKIDAEAIKNRCALPCTNRVTGVAEAKVLNDHDMVYTTCGPAEEDYEVRRPDGTWEARRRAMEGGGRQCHPDLKCLEFNDPRLQRLARIDGQPADWRACEIHYGQQAKPVNPDDPSGGQTLSQRQQNPHGENDEAQERVDKYLADKKELDAYRTEHWHDKAGIEERKLALESERRSIEDDPEAAQRLKAAEQQGAARSAEDEQNAARNQGKTRRP